jgi:UDP-N-acetylmuramoyl-L-alanyl-D-glutamate--2,6-diaminopimelate ligase
VRAAGPGDAVLVAGKGHESVQIIGNEQRPFSDANAVAAALARRAS